MAENIKPAEETKETVSKNFIEQEIDKDLAEGVYDHVQTRFPPEPNGYLHIGHAKSIILNSGLAKDVYKRQVLLLAESVSGTGIIADYPGTIYEMCIRDRL